MSSVAEKLARKQQRSGTTKQVRLKLVYLDFWSVLKLGFLVSVIGAVIMLVATFMVWMVLESTGIFGELSDFLGDILNDDAFDLSATLSLSATMGFTAVIAILNVVVGTALSVIFAVLYNLTVKITGGLLVGFTNN
jgi:hypothetical protein